MSKLTKCVTVSGDSGYAIVTLELLKNPEIRVVRSKVLRRFIDEDRAIEFAKIVGREKSLPVFLFDGNEYTSIGHESGKYVRVEGDTYLNRQALLNLGASIRMVGGRWVCFVPQSEIANLPEGVTPAAD